ncbi:D-alanine--poly(phosphoribitol) ligase subunit 2 [bioreactor metagenome]|jgi:acyl carrier protein|uniref:D-alanine--poly(Phosphoribitol) ligase subunit 2 n=1 Tax=bioreactor metagenome TaxID=1076179 RepID=A0A644Y4I6_9ZZZZ
MREKVLKILKDIKPLADFTTAENFFTSGVLDSFDVIMLISELCDAFDLRFSPSELTPENFDSVDSIVLMIQEKQAER